MWEKQKVIWAYIFLFLNRQGEGVVHTVSKVQINFGWN